MIVWVLIVFIDGFRAGGPLVIDNIASKAECERLLKVVGPSSFTSGAGQNAYGIGGYCTPVRKAKS